MVKHLNRWEIFRKLNAICKVLVKSFSGAKTTCINDYVQTLERTNQNNFIFHFGTNDLSSDKSLAEIARSIIDLATSSKNKKRDVSISSIIIIRAHDKKLEEKRCEVNSFLGKFRKEKNYYLIDHSTRIKRNHLNKGKLHLTLFRMGDKKPPPPPAPTSFSLVISANVGINPQIFLTFSFNLFATLA